MWTPTFFAKVRHIYKKSMDWKQRDIDDSSVNRLSHDLKISSFLATLLCQRAVKEPDQARLFLDPQLAHLSCPFELKGLQPAAERLLRALDHKERILIYCDYDADGVTSSTLLLTILNKLGALTSFFVPRRLEEGYGMGTAAIERAFREEGLPALFVALDCGTNSQKEVAYIRAQGPEVLIVDHHQAKENLPQDCLLLNPHIDSDRADHQTLCTVGLVFKLVHGLFKLMKQAEDSRLGDLRLRDELDLVALGTVADLVPLRGENRTLVHFGLKELAKGRRIGLKALATVSGIKPATPCSTADISFRLAPRINASGRLDDARLPIELLLEIDPKKCQQQAKILDEMNRERQEIELEIVRCAQAQAEMQPQDTMGLVAFHEDWHPGVVGIVAGKLCRLFHKPCIVLGCEGAYAKGSGRGVAGVNLVQVLESCQDLLTTWGGHPMAVGLSLPKERVEIFRATFDQAVKQLLDGRKPEPEILIDAWIEPRDLTIQLLQQMERLAPFGQANPEPILGVRGVVLRYPPEPFGGNQDHIRFKIPTHHGSLLSVVGWKQADSLPPVGQPIDMAIKLGWNTWPPNAPSSLQAEMITWRRSI